MIVFSDSRRVGLACLVLVLVTVAIYWPARNYDFVQYDDPDYILENQTVQNGLTWYGVEWALVDAHVYNYHPVTWLSHMLDCQFFGVNAGAHHFVNVLIHSANGALLFLALRSMTGAFWRSAFVAALFAWHPLRVESVAWISERKDVLSGFFFFLTLLAYAKYAESKVQGSKSKVEPSRPSPNLHYPVSTIHESSSQQPVSTIEYQRSRFYWLSVVFFTLGLLSKPMLVTVPFILLLLDYWPLRRLDYSAHPSSIIHPSIRHLMTEKIPFFLLSLAVGLMTFFAQKSGGALTSLRAEGVGSRIVSCLVGYLGYLENTLWPRYLTFLYLRSDCVPVLTIILAALLMVTTSIFAISVLRFEPALAACKSGIAVGWFWFVLMLLPVSGVVQAGLQSMADRYTYLPSIGLAIMLAWSAHTFVLSRPSSRTVRGSLIVSCAAALFACLNLTHNQLGYWKNTETLMQHALQINPDNYVAHQNLAVYFSNRGLMDAARFHRQRVTQLDPRARPNGTSACTPTIASQRDETVPKTTLQPNPPPVVIPSN